MVNKGIMEEKGLYATYKNVFSQLDKVRGNQELLNNGINHLKSMLKLQIVTEVVSFHSSSDIENMTQFLENTKREIKRKLEFKYDKYFEWEYFEEPQPKLGVLKEDFQKRRDIAYEEHVSEESERKKLFDKEKEEAKASFENTDEYKVFSEALKKLDECLECLSPGKIKNFTKEMFSEELIDKKRYTKIIETCANNMILEKNGIFASEEVNGKPIFVYDEKGNLKIDVDTFVEFSHAINSTKHNSNRINETKEKIDEEKAHLAENSEKIEQLEKQRPLVDAINQEKTNIKDLITKINAKKSSEDIYNVNEKIFYVKNNIEIIEKLEELDELLKKEEKKWFKDKSEIERLRKIVQNNKSKLEMINAENLDIGSIKKENEHLYSEAHSILEKINIEKKVELVGKVLGNEITNEQLEEIKKSGISQQVLDKIINKVNVTLSSKQLSDVSLDPNQKYAKVEAFRTESKNTIRTTILDILSQKYEIPKNYSEINSKESMAKVHERIRVYNDDSYSRYCKLDIDLMKKTEIDSQYNDYIKRYQQNVKYYNNQLDSLNKKHEKSGLPSIDDSLRYRDRYLNENNSKNLSAQLAVLEAIVSAERGELRQDEYDSSEETKNRAIAVVNMLKNKINNAIPSGIQKYDEDRSL